MPHIHEKIDFTAEVFVVHEDKVLLRKHEKYGIWLSVGGHIELDEDPVQAAIREVKEEVGLDIEIDSSHTKIPLETSQDNYIELIPPVSLNRHKINETHEHITMTYVAKSASNDVVPENETDEWLWLTKEELETLDLRPSIKATAVYALEVLGNRE